MKRWAPVQGECKAACTTATHCWRCGLRTPFPSFKCTMLLLSSLLIVVNQLVVDELVIRLAQQLRPLRVPDTVQLLLHVPHHPILTMFDLKSRCSHSAPLRDS